MSRFSFCGRELYGEDDMIDTEKVVAVASIAVLVATTVSANEIRTYDVSEGETLTVTEAIPAGIDVLKTGAGRLVVSNDSNTAFNGTVTVEAGILEAQSSLQGVLNVFGTTSANVITVKNGAQFLVRAPGPKNQNDRRFNNNFVLEGHGPDNLGALRLQGRHHRPGRVHVHAPPEHIAQQARTRTPGPRSSRAARSSSVART